MTQEKTIYVLASSILILLLQSQSILAEVVSDQTLGAEKTIIIDSNIDQIPTKTIKGGARRGSSLFHSFSDFSFENKQSVYFQNPRGVKAIIGRITGPQRSMIDGKLGVLGSADLYLVNPSGITFGPNASLDLSGSFFATTGSEFLFEDGIRFSSINPEAPPLLTIKVPTGIQFQKNPGSIVNHSQHRSATGPVVGLNLSPNQTLGLYGGAIVLDNGIITLPDGRVEIGSLKEGQLSFREDQSLFSTQYDQNSKFGDINIANLSKIDTSGNQGGRINVRAENLSISAGSQLNSSTFGNEPGQGIDLNVANALEILGTTDQPGIFDFLSAGVGILIPLQSGVTTNTFNSGSAGSISIKAQNLILKDGAQVASESFGAGGTGNIKLRVQDSIEIDGLAPYPDNQMVLPGIVPPGLSQEVIIESSAASNISLLTAQAGNSGEINIRTARLSVKNGGIITSSPFQTGEGGDININSTETILVDGTSSRNFIGSQISSSAQGEGNAGDINLRTTDLQVSNGANISTGTVGGGDGGDLNISAKNGIKILQPAIIDRNPRGTTITADSTGNGRAGNVRLNAKTTVIQNSGGVSINSNSAQTPGNLSISSDSIILNGSRISALSTSGTGGNITLDFQDLLLLQNNSEITSTAGQENLPGDGGNIIILGEGLVFALPDSDSDIKANSFNGQGGMINISVNQLLGLEFSNELTLGNDITAFSSNQPEFNGTVDLNIVRSDTQSRIIRLPAAVVDPSKLTQASCSVEDVATEQNQKSRLVLADRDFPVEPTEYRQSPLTRRFWISSDRGKLLLSDPQKTPQAGTVSSHLPFQQGVRTQQCS